MAEHNNRCTRQVSSQILVTLAHMRKFLRYGDEKRMVFQEGVSGPFWMTPQDYVSTKSGQCDDPSLKDKTKDKLLGNLKRDVKNISVVKGERVGELQDITREILISVTKILSKERGKVWMVKQKGILQVF